MRYGWLLLTYLSLLTAVAASHYVFGSPDLFDENFREKYLANLTLIRIHGAAGAVALMLGPFQFMRRRGAWHKHAGRVYLLAVLVAAATSLPMGLIAYGGVVSQAGFTLAGWLWGWTAWRSLVAIRQRRWGEHRAWMVRNFALTFGAVLVRLYLNALQMVGLEFSAIYPYGAWAAWIPCVLAAEALLHRSPGSLPEAAGSKPEGGRSPWSSVPVAAPRCAGRRSSVECAAGP